MTKYEELVSRSEKIGIQVIEVDIEGDASYILNKTIFISQNMNNNCKYCVLAEELGHYFKTYGDITDLSTVENRKQEYQARRWSYELIVGIIDLINAHSQGCRNKFEVAEFLNITEETLESALNYYKCKYECGYEIDNYWINFNNGFEVLEMF